MRTGIYDIHYFKNGWKQKIKVIAENAVQARQFFKGQYSFKITKVVKSIRRTGLPTPTLTRRY